MRNALARVLASTPLALACVGLLLLASAERRLWEADFNRADLLGLKSAENSKVVNLLTDVDRPPGLRLVSVGPAQESAAPSPRRAVASRPFVDHPESRAPPR